MPSNDDWIKSKLDSIENKVDKLDGRLDSVDVNMAKHNVILADHTRRSLANERAVELLKEQIEINKVDISKELTPIKKHVIQVHMVFKVIGVIASGFAVIECIARILEIAKTFQ